jgi:hypothetical protein
LGRRSPAGLDNGWPWRDNRRLSSFYNPLDKEALGLSVRDALLEQPVLSMPPGDFKGAGIYAIYYTGSFRPYKPIADQNKDGKFSCPIYVGKAVPKGSRKGGLIKDPKNSTALTNRLKHHADSISAATNLSIQDFYFRHLVVDDIWIPLGEAYMIEKFQPLWNKVVEGFGIKTPGKRRREQYTSLWDMVHPGRQFVAHLGLPPNPKSKASILQEIEDYLAMPQEQKAKVPLKDEGEPGHDGD